MRTSIRVGYSPQTRSCRDIAIQHGFLLAIAFDYRNPFAYAGSDLKTKLPCLSTVCCKENPPMLECLLTIAMIMIRVWEHGYLRIWILNSKLV